MNSIALSTRPSNSLSLFSFEECSAAVSPSNCNTCQPSHNGVPQGQLLKCHRSHNQARRKRPFLMNGVLSVPSFDSIAIGIKLTNLALLQDLRNLLCSLDWVAKALASPGTTISTSTNNLVDTKKRTRLNRINKSHGR